MIVNSLFLLTDYANGRFNKAFAIPVTQFDHFPSYRFHEVGALRGLSQRRIVYRGAGIERAQVTFYLYPELLEALFSLIGQFQMVDNKVVYTLSNSSAIPSSMRCALQYSTFEGRKVQTAWGVLYELQLNLSSTEFSSATARFVFVDSSKEITNLTGQIGEIQFLTPVDLHGIIVVEGASRQVLINSLSLTYQRKLEPKTSVLGYLVDVFQAEQVAEFELSMLDNSFDTVKDLLYENKRAQLRVQIGTRYMLTIPEFIVQTVNALYEGKIFRLVCTPIGERYSQVQLSYI